MNYYKRHLGDYARKAGHLDMLEHGAYTLLLDAYYEREQPLTFRESIRIARARSEPEKQAVQNVLDEFFQLDSKTDRFIQSRIEEELISAARKAEANKTNGQKGGRPRKAIKPSNIAEFKASGGRHESK